ncbi:penicillin-binding transpeptidase domain-containing protein [Streptomyces thermolineatus]|uniref:Penicillin-binding transpeptidase domain-containing protein n=1 Tax=Streptomyces thermolineatus TaxID=44033 RepID=A0ABN3KUY6_9ACTN
MTRCTRHVAFLGLVLLAGLLFQGSRIQVVEADAYAEHPANPRPALARWNRPRGDVVVGGRPVTGSAATGEDFAYRRTYTDGPLYAPVTGFASHLYGTSGLEESEDAVLSGRDARLSALGPMTALTREPEPGGDVVTTLDPAVQRAAYKALAGRKGALAAVEPSTGRVLALVSTPSYDPSSLAGGGRRAREAWEKLSKDPSRPMLDRALSRTYPPGSAFKAVTATAALTAGAVTDLDEPTGFPEPYRLPNTTWDLENGPGVENCEDAPLRYAFAVSCNTVLARLAVEVGPEAMSRTAEAFGFNADPSPRIPLPVARSVFDTSVDDAQLALSSIGQYNTRATPLQMAMVAAAIANDGLLMRPYLVDRVTDGGGRTVERTVPQAMGRPMGPGVAGLMRELMETAVAEGSGRKAAVPGAVVGGKTGTAQHGEANAGMPYAWFISYARPEGAPETGAAIALAVVVEDGAADRDRISGGGIAAPLAQKVIRAALR